MTLQPPNGGRSDHDLLTRLDERVGELRSDIQSLKADVQGMVGPLTTRVYAIEQVAQAADTRSKRNEKLLLGGVTALLAAVAGFVTTAKERLFG